MKTGFELFSETQGFKMTDGSIKPFNTYDNCSRRYENNKGDSFLISLMGIPIYIGIFPPWNKEDGTLTSFLPSEEMFEKCLNQIIN